MKPPFAPGTEKEPRLSVDGRNFQLSAARTTVGRSEENDVVLEHESVSTTHAEIERQPGRWVLRDLGSTNGTRLNGLAVTEAELRNGDSILFGDCVATFFLPTIIKARTVVLAAIVLVILLAFVPGIWSRNTSSGSSSDLVKGLSGKKDVEAPFFVVDGSFLITVKKVMFGDEVVRNGLLYEHELINARKRGNEMVYFEVEMTNNTRSTRNVSHSSFTLEDTEGLTYKENQTLNYLSGTIAPGARIRGGISFEVPKDSHPVMLVFPTGTYLPNGNPVRAKGLLNMIHLPPMLLQSL